jgi:hypothetical protein
VKDLPIVGPRENLRRAAQQMKHRNVRALPVCDGDRLVGILTDWDVAQTVADERDPAERPVAAYMSRLPAGGSPSLMRRRDHPLRTVPGRDAFRHVRLPVPRRPAQEPGPALRAHGLRAASPWSVRTLDACDPQQRGVLRSGDGASAFRQPADGPCQPGHQLGGGSACHRCRRGRLALRPPRSRLPCGTAQGPGVGRGGHLHALLAGGEQMGR